MIAQFEAPEMSVLTGHDLRILRPNTHPIRRKMPPPSWPICRLQELLQFRSSMDPARHVTPLIFRSSRGLCCRSRRWAPQLQYAPASQRRRGRHTSVVEAPARSAAIEEEPTKSAGSFFKEDLQAKPDHPWDWKL